MTQRCRLLLSLSCVNHFKYTHVHAHTQTHTHTGFPTVSCDKRQVTKQPEFEFQDPQGLFELERPTGS